MFNIFLVRTGLLLSMLAGFPAGTQPEGSDTAPAAAMGPAMSRDARYAFGNERFHKDPEYWEGNPGFLNGLRGFECAVEPVGQPLYFESPYNVSGPRLLFLHHQFSDGSQLQGGQVNVVAVQARLALSERWQFIATKDGYSWFDSGIISNQEGWNDLAAGLKYVFYVDCEADLVASAGARLMFTTGDDEILQSETEELSPFISVAKGWDRFHVVGGLTYRLPFDDDDGNQVFHWDVSASYEVAPDALPGFAPLVELHGVHYTSDGTRLRLSVGGRGRPLETHAPRERGRRLRVLADRQGRRHHGRTRDLRHATDLVILPSQWHGLPARESQGLPGPWNPDRGQQPSEGDGLLRTNGEASQPGTCAARRFSCVVQES